jgi:protein YIPF6
MEAPPAWADPSNRVQQQQQPKGPAMMSASEHEQQLFSKYSTLDEPVLDTILRDVRAVGDKLRVVLMPLDHSTTLLSTASYSMLSSTDSDNNNNSNNGAAGSASVEQELSDNDKMVLKRLKDWDLWGPLVLCLALAVILSFKAPTNQASLVFAAVFCAVWVGGTVVTVNAQLLGGTISFFQSLCVLGYSIFPLTLAAFGIGCMKIVVHTWLWLDMIIVGVGCVWALRTAAVFISLYVKPERRALALYPVVYFYIFLAWMILLF